MKTICMIPCRLGSKRIPKKNIRILDGKPLVAWAIEAAKNAGVFDEIYLNSEDEIFQKIATEYGIKFYKRSPELASDETTNDQFLHGFLRDVECDCVVQLLCTSPFISSQTIKTFTNELIEKHHDALISVKNVQIECLFKNKPINFSITHHTKPSQELEPVKAYACSLMGYNSETFLKAYKLDMGAYHGGYKGKAYFTISGLATIDIDNEFDFYLAEQIAINMRTDATEVRYYGEERLVNTAYLQFLEQLSKQPFKLGSIESDVASILKKDGVSDNVLDESNKSIVSLQSIIDSKPKDSSWSHRVVDCENVSATLIAQLQGESNRKHSHPDIGEFWHIIQGQYEFETPHGNIFADKGCVVFIPKNTVHKITSVGFGLNIRFAVSRADAKHIYIND